MADLRSKLHRRKKPGRAASTGGSRATDLPQTDTANRAFSAAALVDCIPGPALVVNADRRIAAVNAALCDALGLDSAFLYAGEPFADFARRTSLAGSPGLLALGDLLGGAAPPQEAGIVANEDIAYRVRACPAPDGGVLITLSRSAGGNGAPERGGTGIEVAHNIIENMPGAVLRLVREAGGSVWCIFASPLSPQIFGLPVDELTRGDRDFRELVAARDRAPFDAAIGRVVDKPLPVDVEIQVKNAAQGTLWVRCVGAALPAGDGTVLIDVRMIDIEERRKVAEERQQLQTLLDMVVDNIPLMVSVRDVKTRALLIANRAFEEISGHNRKDVLGSSDICLSPDRADPADVEQERARLESGQTVDLPELRLNSPAKGRRVVNTRKYPLYGQNGEVRYILAITEDVTERRQAEDALRRSEQLFRDAIESVTDGIALFDRDERLVLCNRRYRSMWPGFDTAAQPGATFEVLVRHYLETVKESGREIDIETETAARLARYRHPPSSSEVPLINGRWLQVADRATADGGVVVTCTDITALKEREAGLRRASQQALYAKQAAEDANRSKSDFLANMSHELRTPLNAVIGFSEIIKEALLGDASIEPYRGYAQDIFESGHHLLSLINDILDMSKIEAGKLELFEESVDLVAAIEASLRLVRDRAHRNRVTVTTDLPDGLPRLRADLRKVKQIVINLLGNAVKFTPEGGCVVAGAAVAADGSVLLRVSDTGIGISEHDLEKVLAPFGQAEAGLTRQYEGTGLGLTLTKALTELHGGRLEIESRNTGPQTGTTVTAIFPAWRVLET